VQSPIRRPCPFRVDPKEHVVVQDIESCVESLFGFLSPGAIYGDLARHAKEPRCLPALEVIVLSEIRDLSALDHERDEERVEKGHVIARDDCRSLFGNVLQTLYSDSIDR
jgi:hypothetical protein